MKNKVSNKIKPTTVTVHCDSNGGGEQVELNLNLLYQLSSIALEQQENTVMQITPAVDLHKVRIFVKHVSNICPNIAMTAKDGEFIFSWVAKEFLEAAGLLVPNITAGDIGFSLFAECCLNQNENALSLN